MEVIHVPGPPKEAYNTNRVLSDLIKAQIKHLKHLEHKLPPSVRATLPQHAIVTESDAALYIAPMTRLIRSINAVPKPVAKPIPIRRARPISLAAVGSTATTKPPSATKTSPALKGKRKI